LENTFAFFLIIKYRARLKKIALPLLIIFFWVPISCKQKYYPPGNLSADNMIYTDKEFSALSRREGMKRAFIEYIDDKGVLLRPGHIPIIGANAIDYLSLVNDTAFILTWSPTGAGIAASGDLGYTYGIYNMAMKDTVIKGTYVSIWKKQSDGKWKFMLDSGNEGIGDNKK
jgi:ketosteroid isomerase-like protein